MRTSSRVLPALVASSFVALTTLHPIAQSAPRDPFTAEIARWSALVADTSRTDQAWVQARDTASAALAQASQALTDGRRWYALDRFASAHAILAAGFFVGAQPGQMAITLPAFEALWTREGATMQASVRTPPAAATLADIGPAAARAEAEAALAQARVYYETSLQYGRNTTPASGVYYLGLAKAQLQFVDFTRTLPAPARRAFTPHGLGAEIDALQKTLLAAYVPPASIDRHDEFIAASAAVKEARELDHLGYAYGALLKYLQAATRVAMVRQPPAPTEAAAVTARVAEWRTRIAALPGDHTIGDLFVERAEAALTIPNALSTAAAISSDVLPRYLDAVNRPLPAPRPLASKVTVTLVRWPYT